MSAPSWRRVVCLFAALVALPVTVQAQDWPSTSAIWVGDTYKVSGIEPEDLWWAHLMAPGHTLTLGVKITGHGGPEVPGSALTGLELRWTVHGRPVSDWLAYPYTFTLPIDDPDLDALEDGVHDVSFEARGVDRLKIRPLRMYLHLARGRAVSPLVPVISRDTQSHHFADLHFDAGGGVRYVNLSTANLRRSFPVRADVDPAGPLPLNDPAKDFYQEPMTLKSGPHFLATAMVWEQAGPPHAGSLFVRALQPKFGEDHRTLRVTERQAHLPFIDGGRGENWVSPYITGQVDAQGNFYFVESGGPLRVMQPDGNVTTLAGWRVKPDRHPRWWQKPLDVVRANMEKRGTWVNGPSEFWTPLDVAIDPTNPRMLYVAAYEDQAIWKVDATNWENAVVSVFAGSLSREAGYADGTTAAARFNGPTSLTFDPVCDCLYVADQGNDALRKITRAGVVTTLAGRPGQQARLGIPNVYDQLAARAASAFVGATPDLYVPMTVRTDSTGGVIVSDCGFASIRRFDPVTGTATAHSNMPCDFDRFRIGWTWFDVDRLGAIGPKDDVYQAIFNGSTAEAGNPAGCDTTHEAYLRVRAGGGPSELIFCGSADVPEDMGGLLRSNPPHYPWLVAIDPRGAMLLAGGGENGVTRIRKRRADDPMLPWPAHWSNPAGLEFAQGRNLWRLGFCGINDAWANVYGWSAHNMIGQPDAREYRGATDAQLAAAFSLPACLTGADRTGVLRFLRYYASEPGGTTIPPPDPPKDSDGDGVLDSVDACPGTPAGTPVDATGCALPPPTDPCVVEPLILRVTAWPTLGAVSTAGRWSLSHPAELRFPLGLPRTAVAIDARGCTTTVRR